MPATLTAAVTSTAPPTVEILATGLPYTVGNTATLYRDQEGRRATVRGAQAVTLTGADTAWLDYEAAFGIGVTYTVEVRSAAGAILSTTTAAPIQVPVTVPWISDPIDPANATPVLPEWETLREWVHDVDGDAVTVVTDELHVGVTGLMHAPAGIPMGFICLSAAQVSGVIRVLREANPFLWRSPADRPGGRAWYLLAKQIKQTNHKWDSGEVVVVLTFTATQVRPPAASVVVPQRTYAVLPAEASTYGQMPSVYAPPSYLSVLRGRTA